MLSFTVYISFLHSKWSTLQVDMVDTAVVKNNLVVGIPDSKSVWDDLRAVQT